MHPVGFLVKLGLQESYRFVSPNCEKPPCIAVKRSLKMSGLGGSPFFGRLDEPVRGSRLREGGCADASPWEQGVQLCRRP